MNPIAIAALVLGALGLIFGGVLAVVNRVFAVSANEKQAAVRAELPGANCGGCGYPGCDQYAEAVAGGAAVNRCPVGGDAAAQRIGAIMGVAAEAQERLVATVMCRGDAGRCRTRFIYEGPRDCKSASLVAGGDKACAYACLGSGDCARHCPFGAIHVGGDRLAHVDAAKCRGCNVCVGVCPRGALKLLPARRAVYVACRAVDAGKVVRDRCTAGCIGCGKCVRACHCDAMAMENNLPRIDYQKCVDCMACAQSCPTGALAVNPQYVKE